MKILFISLSAVILLSACDVVSDYHMTQSRAVMVCGDGTIIGHIPGTNVYNFYAHGFYGDLDKGVTPEQFCTHAANKTLNIHKS